MKEAFCSLNTIAGKVGPCYRPHYLLHSILWAVSSLEHSRTMFPHIQNQTKAHLYTVYSASTANLPKTLQLSIDSLLWAQIMNLFNDSHFIFTKILDVVLKNFASCFQPTQKIMVWRLNLPRIILNLLQFNNRYSDVFEFLNGYGPWYKCRILFSPIDRFSIVLRTINNWSLPDLWPAADLRRHQLIIPVWAT